MIKKWFVKVAGKSLPLLVFLLGSCENMQPTTIVQVGEIDMPSTYMFGSARLFGELSDSTIAFFNRDTGFEIQLTRGKYFKPFQSIPLPNYLDGRVFSFHIENTDSLLIHEVYREYNKLTWVDFEGKVLDKFDINSILHESIDTYTGTATPLIVHKKQALVYLDRLYDPPYHHQNSLLPLALQIQLDSPQVNCFFAIYPKIYQSGDYHFLTSHRRPYVIQIGGDTTLWGFHATPEVLMYKGCQLVKTTSIPTSYISKVPGFPLKHYENQEHEIAFAHGSPAYSRMYFNPWKRLIYRIILPEQTYKNSDGSYNLHENRKFAIQIIDDKLNLIAEKLITEPMDFERAFAGPYGLYIKTKDDESNKIIIFGLKP
jgi:hypothetical protein